MFRNLCFLVPVVLVMTYMFAVGLVHASVATLNEMNTVCENWLQLTAQEEERTTQDTPVIIESSEPVVYEGLILAYCFHLAPTGFVIVPILKELPPIKAYSYRYDIDPTSNFGFPMMLKEVLAHRYKVYVALYGGLNQPQPENVEPVFSRKNRQVWKHLLVSNLEFERTLQDEHFSARTEVGPLLTTAWHQSAPYNNYAPAGDGGVCVVGCVATAAAQVMRYHMWPCRGTGTYTYFWDGDQSCGGNVGGGDLSAEYSDIYNWDNMPNTCDSGCSTEEEAALAELCNETGVAFQMDYGVCGSGASGADAMEGLVRNFRYDDSVEWQQHSSHSPEAWFAMIREQIDASLPILYVYPGHMLVGDGWRDTGGINQIHLNYGWGGSFTAWYAMDAIAYSPDPLQECMIRNIIPDRKLHIPTDFATIQTGIDMACIGDTVLVHPGVYVENIDFIGKGIVLGSLFLTTRDPIKVTETVIDGNQSGSTVTFTNGENTTSVLCGFTITNGSGSIYHPSIPNLAGGGVFCEGASPRLDNLIIIDNGGATHLGGGIHCKNSSLEIYDTVIANNVSNWGSGVYAITSNPVLNNVTITNNIANSGGGFHDARSHSTLTNSIFWENHPWQIYGSSDSNPHSLTIGCCDIQGGMAGIYDPTATIIWLEGNINEDPMFCDSTNDNYWLDANSPCAEENNAVCGQIGALGVGCNELSGVDGLASPSRFIRLHQNNPNPFNAATTIAFELIKPSLVSLRVYDLSGHLMRTILDDYAISAGQHEFTWNGEDNSGHVVGSGVYVYRLMAGSYSAAKRMVLLK
jgi:hypothetical protein